jgi:hypothetical protein
MLKYPITSFEKIKLKGIPSVNAMIGPELKDVRRFIDIDNYINLVGANELPALSIK